MITVPQPKPFATDSEGDWTITVYDFGKSQPMHVELSLHGSVQRVGKVEGYKLWTLLAHWKDGLP